MKMSRKSTMAQLVSVLALLGGCQGEKPATGPESMHMDANLVEITDVSSKGENLHLISLRLSDKSGNSIEMTAGSTVNYLEGGRYSLVQDNIGNRDFTATADVDGQLREIESGNLTVTRKNDSYSLSLALHSPGLEMTASTKDKNIYFDKHLLDKMPKDGNAGFTSGLKLKSKVIGQEMLYSVYLPGSYDGVKEFPVLYILHGMWGTHSDWFNHNRIHEYAAHNETASGKEMIIVSPNAFDSFYCDGHMAGINFRTYFFDEFIPHIESTYKVKTGRGNRAIAGLSMGGYGSLYYGMSHPEMFCCVYACSAACYGSGTATTPALSSFFKSPKDLPELVMEMGTEDQLFSQNESFVKELDAAGIQYEYITRRGAHDSRFWEECAPKILRKLNGIF